MAESIPLSQTYVKTEAPWRERLFPNNEWVLLVVLLVEGAIFSVTGNNFLTSANAFEITRLSVEIGLLALVMTPIIITGGIDLSVGSMMGLAAVVMGALWRDAHLPMAVAIAIALFVGLLGGALNALVITRLNFPPLIVTLGTFSLFRGVAEGLTRGIENYSGFSPRFLFLGQGYVGGIIPTQLFILIASNCCSLVVVATHQLRAQLIRDRFLGRRSALRGHPRRPAIGFRLCAVGAGGESRRGHLCRTLRPGEIGRGHWL